MTHSTRANRNLIAPADTDMSTSAAGAFAIVVPCHNEVDSLPNLQVAIGLLRKELPVTCRLELILVDDGSTDGTLERMHELFGNDPGTTLLRQVPKRGIAAAIAMGILHAQSEIVATLDADCTYHPTELVPMLRLLADDVDMVVASPYHPHGGVLGVPAWRLGLSQGASRLYRRLMRNKLHTYTSCVRVYRRSSVVDLPLQNDGFVGVVELLWQLDRRGGKIVEHPAVLRTRTTGQSKMRVARATLAHIRMLCRAFYCRLAPQRVEPIRTVDSVSTSTQHSFSHVRNHLSSTP